jgi:hypothetical protein
MKSFFENKPQVAVLLFVFLVVAFISSPFWLWQLKPERTLDILIVDKTVPDQSYREHKGLTWVLNNEKYTKGNGEPYSATEDYIGFKHETSQSYTEGKLPEKLDQYKVIYLADLYGVYEDEFYGRLLNDAGNNPRLLYGGLLQEDVDKLQDVLKHGKKTLIAEFNTFGSPTEEAVRKQMTNLLNINWTGWTGRYFSEMDGQEVPEWIIDQYNLQSGNWGFQGAGFVFVNVEDEIVVLGKEELTGKGLDFVPTEQGDEFFEENIGSKYRYWFDIIQPLNDDEVLAEYKLPVSKKAFEKLSGYGIPIQFAAVVHHENEQYSSYYFAGDYADEAEVPGIYQTVGLTLWRKASEGDDSFYWSTYVPMMKKILYEF